MASSQQSGSQNKLSNEEFSGSMLGNPGSTAGRPRSLDSLAPTHLASSSAAGHTGGLLVRPGVSTRWLADGRDSSHWLANSRDAAYWLAHTGDASQGLTAT